VPLLAVKATIVDMVLGPRSCMMLLGRCQMTNMMVMKKRSYFEVLRHLQDWGSILIFWMTMNHELTEAVHIMMT
jgi:hypothetical protein